MYEDDAVSGSQMQRLGLDQLMQAASDDDDVQVILAWDRNRIARPKDASGWHDAQANCAQYGRWFTNDPRPQVWQGGR
ncbi:MAG: recombinase family protein, partial [Phycisphaeraceae bacterium]|nr:recombinase family protein [Phycisphaeraceae bacterium]